MRRLPFVVDNHASIRSVKYYSKVFCKLPEKIANIILADRFGTLVHCGIAEKWIPDEELGREVYRLSAKEQSLKLVSVSVADWGLDNIQGTEAWLQPK